MSWDAAWDEVFRSQAWGRYPPEELIRFVARNFYEISDRSRVRVLDVGCGPGAGVWYLAREGFDTSGIDASAIAIRQAAERLSAEGLRADLQVGDLIALTELYQPQSFDAVVDVTSVQHNRMGAILLMHKAIERVLKPGGRVFAIMVSSGACGDGVGDKLETGTFAGIREGPLRGKGVTHFSTLEEIQQIFAPYRDVEINVTTRTLDHRRIEYPQWVIEGVKSR